MRPRIRILGALLATALLASCEDPFEQTAERSTLDVPLEAWALSGTPPDYPSALVLDVHTVIRPESQGLFDIAFDIDADGRLMVLPLSKVISPLGGLRQIGLQRATQDYSLILEVPRTGWVFDSVLVVNPGDTFLVKAQQSTCSAFALGPDIHAKIYVEAVDPVTRRIALFMRLNPNCGYRSLLAGIPEY